jgi:hypothetical protein
MRVASPAPSVACSAEPPAGPRWVDLETVLGTATDGTRHGCARWLDGVGVGFLAVCTPTTDPVSSSVLVQRQRSGKVDPGTIRPVITR